MARFVLLPNILLDFLVIPCLSDGTDLVCYLNFIAEMGNSFDSWCHF